ncbi:hypothetical protein [Microcoleus vaginatus]|uniref:hypothetical protein n=1 Tax=Microcoleus vaginatus TaxID=119532 RepID=UPI0032A8F388
MVESVSAIAFWDGKVDRTLCLFLNAQAIAQHNVVKQHFEAEERLTKKNYW